MRFLFFIALSVLLTGCWPSSVSFIDKGGMNPDWKFFTMETLENKAYNTPLSYPATLTETIKDGVQNNTRLLLSANPKEAQIQIEGVINSYSITPVAIQNGDNAAKNRLTVSASFVIYIVEDEEEMKLTSTRFLDYDSNTDLGIVEGTLLEDVNTQIVQDVVNKLLSNW